MDERKLRKITKQFVSKNKDAVERLAAIGSTNEEIGFVLQLSPMSVYNHFRDQLERGRAHLRTSLRKAQIDSALNDKNTAMLIWLGKAYLGQKEPRHDINHTGDITLQKVMYGSAEYIEDNKNSLLLA